MELGEFIRSIRVQKGLTQIQLAENAGVSVNTIRLYEADRVSPKAVTLEQIAKALGFSDLEDLLYFLNRSTTPETEKIFDKSTPMSKKISISRNAMNLSQEEVDALCGFPEGTVQKYENELIEPSWDRLQKLSTALQVPLFALSDKDINLLKLIDSARLQIQKAQKRNESLVEWDSANNLYEELEASQSTMHLPERKDLTLRIVQAASQLNDIGKAIAVQRIKELAEIPRYQAKPTAEPTNPTPEGNDPPKE